MVQPASKRLVTEAAVGGHVLANLPARLSDTSLNGAYGPSAQAASPTLKAAFAAVGTRPDALVAANGSGAYEQNSNTYNFKASALRKFRAKLAIAQAGFGRVHIVCAGDSTTAGFGASVAQGFPAVLKQELVKRGVPDGGPGYVFFNQGISNTFIDGRLSLDTAVFGNDGGYGFYRKATTSGATATVSEFGNNSTTVMIGYLGLSANFNYRIDGGAAVTVTSPNSDSRQEVVVPNLSDASHTVYIDTTSTAATYPKYVAMVKSSGLIVTNAGAYGFQSAQWQGMGTTTTLGDVYNLYPDLVIYNIGINDATSAIPIATFKTNVQNVITALKGGGADFILTTSNPINPASGNLAPYSQALYELADSQDVPLVDLYERTGDWATMSANNLKNDDLHPNAGWYMDKGRALAGILLR